MAHFPGYSVSVRLSPPWLGLHCHASAPAVVRYAAPYDDDSRFGGVLIQGSDEYAAFQVKIFYIKPSVKPGQILGMGSVVGQLQAISLKYGPNTLDHVHVEIRKDGQLVDPATLLSVAT